MAINTVMEKECLESPSIIERQLMESVALVDKIVREIDVDRLKFAVIIGRGSSENAGLFAKYLIETELRIPVVMFALSVQTVCHANLKLKDALVIGISQSGKSPDICEAMKAAKNQGALTIAVVNEENSPICQFADFVLPILAGKEKAVAATKSFIASISAITILVAKLNKNEALLSALAGLPEAMRQAINIDFNLYVDSLKNLTDTLVIGRVFNFAFALEAALKCKETSALHGEAFSSAEVMHGPFELVKPNKTFLLISSQDEERARETFNLAQKIKNLGASSLVFTQNDHFDFAKVATVIRLPKTPMNILDPIVFIFSFYLLISKVAIARNCNPDSPQNLNKVTETF